jgi:hypothetical protein
MEVVHAIDEVQIAMTNDQDGVTRGARKTMNMHHLNRPQGEIGQARFKQGDRVRIRELQDAFHARALVYKAGAVGTVADVQLESAAGAAARDDAGQVEWYYSVIFKQRDLWSGAGETGGDDTLETELPERYLELT